MTEDAQGQLKRSIGLLDLVMLGAGTAIGSAIFTVLGPAAQVGGAGILITVVVAAAPMTLFGLVYAFMSSALPTTAASYEWQRRFTHPAVAFSVVWLRVLSLAITMIVLGNVMVNFLDMVIALPRKLFILVLFIGLFALNYRGVALAARAQTILMLALLGVFAVFLVAGAPHLDTGLLIAAARGGWSPILAALPLMIQLFLGIETATEVGGEVENPTRNVPLGLGLALALTVVVYVAMTFTALSLVGPQALSGSKAPLLTAAQAALGPSATPLICTAAVLALTKSLNAVFLVFSRILYMMGRAGDLPRSLGRIHPRFGTPHIATLVALLASGLAMLLPSSLLFLLLAVSVPTMMKYFGSCLAAYNVAARHPDVRLRAALPFSARLVKILAGLGMLAATVIAVMGFETDWRPYLLLLAWLLLGLTYFVFRGKWRRHWQC
jgi:APA family basic amino acid/polyamine antiporter